MYNYNDIYKKEKSLIMLHILIFVHIDSVL